MTLLHPWAVMVGLAAIALPVLIHLLTRPRPVRMALSTVRFVRQAVQQKRARNRLRDILILAMRTGAVALLALAFARPMAASKPQIDPAAAGSVVRIIILDDSLSMSEVVGASSAFERARAEAARFLPAQSDLRANLIVAAARPHPVFDNVTPNIPALRDALSAATPQPQRLDLPGAINRAAEMFAASPRTPDGRMELIVVSNFQRANWASADFSPLPKDVHIQLQSVAPEHPPDNLAILRAGARGRLEVGRTAQLEVDIGNYSATPRQVDVQVDLGEVVSHLQGLCPAGVKTTLSSTVMLPDKPGWLVGEAKLDGVVDALAGDNSRPVAMRVEALPVYALITRESSRPHPSSSHYIERALAPTLPRPGQISESVVRLDPEHLDRDAAGTASLLVLDHPGTLSEENEQYLLALVRRGKGLLYIAAEPQDAANLARLSRIAGQDMKMPVEFLPPPDNQPRQDLFLLDWQRDQAPFDQLGDTISAVAGSLRFNRGLASRRLPDGLADDILATYSDRSACLVATPCGAGTIAVLNADLMATNLAGSSLFVPMIEELSNRLLGSAGSSDAAPCGEPLAVDLPMDCAPAKGLAISSHGPEVPMDFDPGSLTDEPTGVLWRADAAGPPGFYTVHRGDKTDFALATAAPASQSDLQTIDPNVLTTRLAGGRDVDFQPAGGSPRVDRAWVWLLAACAVCLVAEVGLLKLFKT